ncbi:MAG: hypothetical protein RR485_08110 [Mucinivorans sp.]
MVRVALPGPPLFGLASNHVGLALLSLVSIVHFWLVVNEAVVEPVPTSGTVT